MFTLKSTSLVVRAQQVTAHGGPHHETPAGPRDICRCTTLERPHIHTLEGPVPVREGDWIVTRAAGDRHVCTREMFDTAYEALIETVQQP